MPALLATRTRVAQEGVCWRGCCAAAPAHTLLQQGAALRGEQEQWVHQNALVVFLGTIDIADKGITMVAISALCHLVEQYTREV